MIKMDFHGSGHDCWDRNSDFCKKINTIKGIEETQLEKKLKEETKK